MGSPHGAPPPDPAPVVPEPVPEPEPEVPEVEDDEEEDVPDLVDEEDVPVARSAALIEEALNATLNQAELD
jgi:hypothetical protein